MAYKRKTRDWYAVYGLYETGWEFLGYDETYNEAVENCKLYMKNEHIFTKIVKEREKLEV